MPVSSARLQHAQPSAGEDVVISGLAGCFPGSENVYQLRDNLFNKVDMVTHNVQREQFGQYFS
jgi:acyl transferase domain-containing protein